MLTSIGIQTAKIQDSDLKIANLELLLDKKEQIQFSLEQKIDQINEHNSSQNIKLEFLENELKELTFNLQKSEIEANSKSRLLEEKDKMIEELKNALER
jgi:hypothetical protein